MLLKIFKPYDVFIAYVAEDREIVETLYKRLSQKGLRIWYANRELYPGANIRSLISEGLAMSRHGIVIISPRANSAWMHGELFVLMSKKGRFIPVLHEITLHEAAINYPGITDVMCLKTAGGAEHITEAVSKLIKPRPMLYSAFAHGCYWIKKNTSRVAVFMIALFSVALAGILVYSYYAKRPSAACIEASITQRISNVQDIAMREIKRDIAENTGSGLFAVNNANDLLPLQYNNNICHARIYFKNGYDTVISGPGLKQEGIIIPSSMPEPVFGLTDYRTYQLAANASDYKYGIYNMSHIRYKVTETRLKDKNTFEADISYENHLRYIHSELTVNEAGENHDCITTIWGLKPHETMVFRKHSDTWELADIL